MTDPNQPKFFVSKKNGKKYKHYKTHKANERQVAKDIYKEQFKEHHGRDMTNDEMRAFKCGFSMGYKEGRKRTTSNLKTKKKNEVFIERAAPLTKEGIRAVCGTDEEYKKYTDNHGKVKDE